MAFDKAKTIRAAEKHLSQGKITAAIQQYRQIVEQDRDDFTALNTLGDLYSRTENTRDAVACFKEVARHYRQQGFALKAIAIYKKICRLDPGEFDATTSLAELFETQGLLVEARAQYLSIAEVYAKSGNVPGMLEVMRKISDLEPGNIDARLRLATAYESENYPQEAVATLLETGSKLVSEGNSKDSIEVFTRALRISPGSTEAHKKLIEAHIASGSFVDNAANLEEAVLELPPDVEVLSLLATSYIKSGNSAAAERISHGLLKSFPSSIQTSFEVALLYSSHGDFEGFNRVVSWVQDITLSQHSATALIELLDDELQLDPQNVAALSLLARVYEIRLDAYDEKLVLNRLMDASGARGFHDLQSETAERLSRISSKHDAIHSTKDLHSQEETLDSAEFLGHTSGRHQAEELSFDGFVSDKSQIPEPVIHADEGSSAAEFDWSMPSFSPQDFAQEQTGPDPFTQAIQETPRDHSTTSAVIAENSEDARAGYEKHGPSQAGNDWALSAELESVDFYLAQGYADIARETLGILEQQYGSRPEIEERRAKLESAGVESVPVATSESVAPTSSGNLAVAEDTVQETGTGIDPGLAEIFSDFRSSVEEEEPETADYETHYNLGLAYKEMELLAEAVEEFQAAIALVSPRDGTPRYLQCCNLLGHCFLKNGMPKPAALWLKKGLNVPDRPEDEYQALRYELGTAYETMGDLDHAIEVFSEVYAIDVFYRGVSDRLQKLQAKRSAR